MGAKESAEVGWRVGQEVVGLVVNAPPIPAGKRLHGGGHVKGCKRPSALVFYFFTNPQLATIVFWILRFVYFGFSILEFFLKQTALLAQDTLREFCSF